MEQSCIEDLPEDTEPSALLETKPVVDFLCIAAQSSTISTLLRSNAVLVPVLSQWACSFEKTSTQVENYRATVVLLFALLTHGTRGKKKEPAYDSEALHDIMLDTGPTSVLSAGAYAVFARKMVTKRGATQLMRLEAWDYFIDALHLSPDDPDVFAYRDLLEVSFPLYCAALDAALGSLHVGTSE
ncbi:hypothetical protein CALCODRAFT_211149 [Calocera cornea HHB12733]|uniref:Uncharacterized protein n=1 Tax=Calocera cornea HHB12733 TaxID=1353952 RepID=A0A165HF46_9BASI|nr:hypothetical protein CALCODRAFT_211149 [Calocera cornea HHB12733]